MKTPVNTLYILFGLFGLFSACLINPWLGAYYRDPIVNYADVMGSYFVWAIILGTVFLLLGWKIRLSRSDLTINTALLTLSFFLIVLFDRMLLAVVGLPYWIPDQDLHYRHRPSITRVWGQHNPISSLNPREQGKLIHINRHGHHDDDFSRVKPTGQYRGLFIGDSVVMGHGVTKDETFVNQLELLLQKFSSRYESFQMINAGVQGYSTSQERIMMEQSLVFSPDFIAIGFFMNDVTKPFTRVTGATTAPHQLISVLSGSIAPNLALRFMINETGFGRLIQLVRSYGHRRGETDHWSLDIASMSAGEIANDTLINGWRIVLTELEQIYATARSRDIPIVLMIFPGAPQLFEKDLQKPQKTLQAHAHKHNVDSIDFTTLLEEAINREIKQRFDSLDKPLPNEEDMRKVHKLYRNKYYLDEVHFTEYGHREVSLILAQYMNQRLGIELDKNGFFQVLTEAVDDKHLINSVVVPPEPQALFDLGDALKILDMDNWAIDLYRAGIATKSDPIIHAQLYFRIGDIYQKAGYNKEAMSSFSRVAELATEDISLSQQLQARWLQLGAKERAAQAAKNIKRLEPIPSPIMRH